MKFSLHFHETSKNYRVLVDGKVHPLLCGLPSWQAANEKVREVFGSRVVIFENLVLGKEYLNAGGISSKQNAIAELEKAIAVLQGMPEDRIDDIEISVDIKLHT